MLVILLKNTLLFVLLGLWLVVIARVLLSFVDPGGRGPIGRFVFSTTEPLLAPIRRVLPQTGVLDFSPMILMIVIGVLLRAVA